MKDRGQCSQTPSANVSVLGSSGTQKVPMDLMYPNNRRHEHGLVILILLYRVLGNVSCSVVLYIALRIPQVKQALCQGFL